jgi:hypothetical protein
MVYQISGKLNLILIFLKCIIFADGMLTVHTVPENIEVWIDDQYIGNSPIIDKKLRQGRYNLRLIDPIQHNSETENIFINDNDSLYIEKAIQSRYGKLQVNSNPPGAKVLISTDLGETPLLNDFMNPGKYRIEIRQPGKKYQISTSDIIIPKGETVKIDKELKKNNLMNKKAILRLSLGACAIGGLIWAVVDQGQYKQYSLKASGSPSSELQNEYQTKADNARLRRTIAVSTGVACIISFEIVSFF